MSPVQAATALRKLAQGLVKATGQGIALALDVAKKEAVADYRETGLGRRAFKSDAAARRTVYVPRVIRDLARPVEMKVYGLTALMETGGRTRAHAIPKRSQKRVAFVGANGKLVVVQKVMHPGGPVHAINAAAAALRRAADGLPTPLDSAYKRLISTVGLG